MENLKSTDSSGAGDSIDSIANRSQSKIKIGTAHPQKVKSQHLPADR
ncbi:hypothetical protein QUB63_19655 [Microcoleus sp. ARI1-B5]